MKKFFIATVVIALALSTPSAQAPKADDKKVDVPPVLTDVQKKDIQIAAQQVEIWNLRAQQAAAEFQKAQQALNQLIAQLTPQGYAITEKLELVKVAPPKKDDK